MKRAIFLFCFVLLGKRSWGISEWVQLCVYVYVFVFPRFFWKSPAFIIITSLLLHVYTYFLYFFIHRLLGSGFSENVPCLQPIKQHCPVWRKIWRNANVQGLRWVYLWWWHNFLSCRQFLHWEVGKWNALILEFELASHLTGAGPVLSRILELCILIWKVGENHSPLWDQPHLLQKSMVTGSERTERHSRLFFVRSTYFPF